MSTMEKQISDFLETGKDWDKASSKLPGVFIVKMPATKSRPALLALEVNPERDGKPLKRKGLFITSTDMLMAFNEALKSDSLFKLMTAIDEINSTQNPKGSGQTKIDID
jgi:hypothetical protein